MRVSPALGAALAMAAGIAPQAGAAEFTSLDGVVAFDAAAGTVAVSGRTPLFPVFTPPAPFTLDGQRLEVVCRAPAARFGGRVDGPVPETRLTLGLNASPPPLPGRLDLPECRFTREYLLRDGDDPVPQRSLEQVPLLPADGSPLARVPLRWRGVGAGARITLGGSRISIDARGARSALWASEALGERVFAVVCDLGGRRVAARFPGGLGRDRRASATLRSLGQPRGARRGFCRLGDPVKFVNERRDAVAGLMTWAAVRPVR